MFVCALYVVAFVLFLCVCFRFVVVACLVFLFVLHLNLYIIYHFISIYMADPTMMAKLNLSDFPFIYLTIKIKYKK